MNTPKVTVTRVTSYHVSSPEHGAVETQYQPVTYLDMLMERVGNRLLVGYLTDAPYALNPLTEYDGYGRIYGRGKYETAQGSESEMFEAMGFNRDGDPNIEHDAVIEHVNGLWQKYVESIQFDTLFSLCEKMGFDDPVPEGADDALLREVVYRFRDELYQVDINHEQEFKYAVSAAAEHTTGLAYPGYATYSWFQKISEICSELNLEFDAVKLGNAAWWKLRDEGKVGDPDTVLLDVYDHSGLAWSVHGGGTQCRWDTSRGAGVWVPDESARGEIDSRAELFTRYLLRKTPYDLRGAGKKFQLLRVLWSTSYEPGLEHVEFSDDHQHLWTTARRLASEVTDTFNEKQKAWAREQARDQLAQECINIYNEFINGAVYEVVLELFSLKSEEGDPIWVRDGDEELVCTDYGSDVAEESLQSEFNRVLTKLQGENHE